MYARVLSCLSLYVVVGWYCGCGLMCAGVCCEVCVCVCVCVLYEHGDLLRVIWNEDNFPLKLNSVEKP